MLFYYLVRFIALFFPKKKEVFGCENTSYDDIQGVMAWMDCCGNLWQMSLEWDK